MTLQLIVICVWLLAICVGVWCDKEMTKSGITTKVKGQSGKISVYKANSSETDGVTITYDAIREISGGERITSHSFNTFATMSFTFSEIVNKTYPNSTVQVSQFSFDANIPIENSISKLTSDVIIFEAAGNIKVDGQDFAVTPGLMKFNVKVSNWSFCSPCQSQGNSVNGEFLDVEVEIKGKQTPKATVKTGQYDLGGGASVTVPKDVIVDTDSNVIKMPTGYPSLTAQGTKNIFTFRLPKFTTMALYDPTVSLESSDSSSTPTQAPGAATSAKVSASLLLVLLIATAVRKVLAAL